MAISPREHETAGKFANGVRLAAGYFARLQSVLANPTAAIIVSLSALVLGFAVERDAPTAGKVLIVLGVAVALVSARLSNGRLETASRDATAGKADRIARQMEQLKDAHWQLTDNEARYLNLLDTQQELIARRDMSGRLVFANKAFCRTFGEKFGDLIGEDFAAARLVPVNVGWDAGGRTHRHVEFIATQMGSRWISWEEQRVPAVGGGTEIQSVGRDITEQRQAEVQLREARDQAQGANRAKSRFLAAMSHEIRTPMNGILGMASLLLEMQQSKEEKDYTIAIDQSARALLALIDEILDFSKIEAGKLELANGPFSIRDCVQKAVELLAPRAAEKALDLRCSVAPDVPTYVTGDEARVRQIVLNLLSNAVKFTDAGSVAISVGCVSNGAANIAVTVKDTGIGLSPEDMTRLFDEFEQADAAIQRREGGTGLGLAISRRLAKAMGGDILVGGRRGHGATFTALLRLEPAAFAVHEAASNALPSPLLPTDAATIARTPSTYARQHRVLVAEDNAINALLARRVIENEGYEVVVANDGLAAVEAVRMSLQTGARAFDLILMDVFMPKLDGLEATRAIRQLYAAGEGQPTSAPPIVALTANAFAEDRARCIAAGMSDYLAKPFDAKQLKNIASKWIGTAAPGV